MKKLKILLQHNIIYYVFLFIVIILYIGESNINHESVYKEFNNEKMTITNIETKDYGLKLSLKGKEKVLGYLYIDKKEINNYLSKYTLGDRIKVSGDIEEISNNTVPNTFNYKKYLTSNKIYNVITITKIKKISSNKNVLYKIKKVLIKRGEKLTKSYPYISSLIFGNNSYIDEDAINSYRDNGISHLFAISGLHISIFILIISFILDKLRFKAILKYLLIILFLLFYMFLTNFSMSVIRGSLFAVLIILNKLLKLEIPTKNLLILALIIIMFNNPLYINNVGLLYSFLVTFSLIIFSNLIKGSKVKQLFMISLIAFLISYPITINNFNGVNFLSIVYNIFFVPYISSILLPLVLISYIFPLLDSILFAFISVIENISLLLTNITIGKISMCHMNYILISIYYLMVYITLKKLKSNKYKMFIVLIIFFIIHYFLPINNNNYIMFLDVGQGDSILIRINNSNTLIDTGGKITYDDKEYNYSIARNKLLPYLKSVGIRKLDNLILTHGDADHMKEAIYLVQNFRVNKVIFNNNNYNDLEKELISVLKKENISYAKNINNISMGSTKLRFLNTNIYNNENDASSVIYMKYKNSKYLFMGDAGIEREYDILNKYNISNIDFLKIGHHGSDTSSSPLFINKIKPINCIISVGKDNKFGHPKENVMDVLDNYCHIYRTDIDGSTKIDLNKSKHKIKTYNP